MDYDNWRLSTPESFDYEEDRECFYCGFPMKDTEIGWYCSKQCRAADSSD